MKIDDLIKEAKREAAVRRRVFPDWIRKGKIRKDEADRRIIAMEKIAQELTRLKRIDDEAQNQQLNLL